MSDIRTSEIAQSAVFDHDALGPSGRTGGVDDVGEVGSVQTDFGRVDISVIFRSAGSCPRSDQFSAVPQPTPLWSLPAHGVLSHSSAPRPAHCL